VFLAKRGKNKIEIKPISKETIWANDRIEPKTLYKLTLNQPTIIKKKTDNTIKDSILIKDQLG